MSFQSSAAFCGFPPYFEGKPSLLQWQSKARFSMILLSFSVCNPFSYYSPPAYLTLTYWPHCCPLTGQHELSWRALLPVTHMVHSPPLGYLFTCYFLISPSCLKLHPHLTLPFPLLCCSFLNFSILLLNIYCIHLRLSKLFSILGGKPHERKCFPWVLGWGSALFLVFFQP